MKKLISFLLTMLLILGAGAAVVFCFYRTPAPVSEPTVSVDYYIVNKHSNVFHLPNCPSIDQMAPYNKLLSHKSRDELVAEGYKPCGHCNP